MSTSKKSSDGSPSSLNSKRSTSCTHGRDWPSLSQGTKLRDWRGEDLTQGTKPELGNEHFNGWHVQQDTHLAIRHAARTVKPELSGNPAQDPHVDGVQLLEGPERHCRPRLCSLKEARKHKETGKQQSDMHRELGSSKHCDGNGREHTHREVHSSKSVSVAAVIIVNDAAQVFVARENMNHARCSMGRERKRVVLFLYLRTVFAYAAR